MNDLSHPCLPSLSFLPQQISGVKRVGIHMILPLKFICVPQILKEVPNFDRTDKCSGFKLLTHMNNNGCD